MNGRVFSKYQTIQRNLHVTENKEIRWRPTSETVCMLLQWRSIMYEPCVEGQRLPIALSLIQLNTFILPQYPSPKFQPAPLR